jgi:tetratricopeptide (TPR) repeat protein
MRIFGIFLIVILFGCNNSNDVKSVEADPKNIDSLVALREKDYLSDTTNLEFKKSYVNALLKRGNQKLKDFDMTTAFRDAATAFRMDSLNFDVRMLYADALSNRYPRSREDVMAARRHYEYLTKKNAKSTKAIVGLGSTFNLEHESDFEKAISYADQALKIDKRYMDAYVLKGSTYLKMGNMKLAKSSYETAIQQDNTFHLGYIMLGALYQSENDEICIQYYQSAVELKPTDAETLFALAYAQQIFGQPEKAMLTYRKMIKLKQLNYQAQALNQIGVIKQHNFNQLDSAIYYYNSATQSDSTLVEAWHNLGTCYESKKDLSGAMRAYGRALHFNPEFELSRKRADVLKYAR